MSEALSQPEREEYAWEKDEFHTGRVCIGEGVKHIQISNYNYSYDNLPVKAYHGLRQTWLANGEWLVASDVPDGYITYFPDCRQEKGARIELTWTHEDGSQESLGAFPNDAYCHAVLYQDGWLYCYSWQEYVDADDRLLPSLIRVQSSGEKETYVYSGLDLEYRDGRKLYFIADQEGNVYWTQKDGIYVCAPNGTAVRLWKLDREEYPDAYLNECIAWYPEDSVLVCRVRADHDKPLVEGFSIPTKCQELLLVDLNEGSYQNLLRFETYIPRLQMLYYPSKRFLIYFAMDIWYLESVGGEYYHGYGSPSRTSEHVVALRLPKEPDGTASPILLYTTAVEYSFSHNHYPDYYPYPYHEELSYNRILTMN